MKLDASTLERHPLLTDAGLRMLRSLREHPDAPRFNYVTGDRLRAEDVPVLEGFRQELAEHRWLPGRVPAPDVMARVRTWREQVPLFHRTLAPFADLQASWTELPTTSRADLAVAPWELVPHDLSLDRMIIYRTAGTTGHAITVPHHPLSIRAYEPMVEAALQRHGISSRFESDEAACFLVGAQVRTFTYAAVMTQWNEAGFAKLNLRATEWNSEHSAARYFQAFAPRILTGDPLSFAEMMRQEIRTRPRALLSTSVAMSPTLKARLSERYQAPVIDWYSLVETGPIAYFCRLGHGYHLLPPDLFVEALRPDGSPCGPGERGEITVTGGRNPFVPLLRYRTGDWGSVENAPCVCGDTAPRVLGLEGRQPIVVRAEDGSLVSTVDLSRILREQPLLLHEFVQHRDHTCELTFRPLPGAHVDTERMEADLRRVLGALPLTLREDPVLGDRQEGKVMAYRSELMVED